ncbi:hypothetical protein [Kitasatospora sp. HPMI-4]|uniref:hypothetical protein n=1 Tax=Kitasatospora sp. HPMI-4 TaxID=3448443 RepID=UPI003F1993BE
MSSSESSPGRRRPADTYARSGEPASGAGRAAALLLQLFLRGAGVVEPAAA